MHTYTHMKNITKNFKILKSDEKKGETCYTQNKGKDRADFLLETIQINK